MISLISCIAWNPYKKQVLSSADYDGIVYIWDTATNHRLQMFQVKLLIPIIFLPIKSGVCIQ